MNGIDKNDTSKNGGDFENNTTSNGDNSNAAEKKKNEFRRYLHQSDVVDVLTKALVTLYEDPDRPDDALNFLRNYLRVDSNSLASSGATAADPQPSSETTLPSNVDSSLTIATQPKQDEEERIDSISDATKNSNTFMVVQKEQKTDIESAEKTSHNQKDGHFMDNKNSSDSNKSKTNDDEMIMLRNENLMLKKENEQLRSELEILRGNK